MEKRSEIAVLDNGSIAKTNQLSRCGCLIISSPLIGGVLFCLLILIMLDNTLDRGQCTLARSTPTSPPIQVVAPIEIQSKLPNQVLQKIGTSNAMNLMELAEVNSLPIRVQKLSFNPDNTLSVINDTTWLDTHWSDVAIDPQGKTIVYIEGTASEPSVVRGCDIESKRQIFAFSSDETANQVRFSSDEKLFAINEGRGTISIFDAVTHSKLASFDVLDGKRWVNTNQLAFSPDSSLLAFAMDNYQDHDYSIRIWDIKTLKQIASLQGHTGEILGLVFNDSGTLIASVSKDGSLRLWGAP